MCVQATKTWVLPTRRAPLSLSLHLSVNAPNVSRTCGYARISGAHAAYTQCGQSAAATVEGKARERGKVEGRELQLKQHWQDLRAQFVANSLALLLHYIKNKSQWQTSRRPSPASFCSSPSCCLCRQLLCKVIKMLNVKGELEGRREEELLLLLLLHFSHFHSSHKVWQQTLNCEARIVLLCWQLLPSVGYTQFVHDTLFLINLCLN